MPVRKRDPHAFAHYSFVGATGDDFFQGIAVGVERAAGATQGQIRPMGSTATLVFIGYVERTLVDAPAGSLIQVWLDREHFGEWYDNDAVNTADATDVGGLAYFEDERTVGTLATGHALAGRIVAVDVARDKVFVSTTFGG